MPVTDFSRGNHLLIGDSLPLLQRLCQDASVCAQVKMIYIDPPYNTGNTFAYRDARRPQDWIEMMQSRLLLARQLLRPDGLIFISIDLNQFAELKLLCDQVFSAENLVANFVWVSNLKGRQLGPGPAGTHEYILCYARDRSKVGKLRGDIPELSRLMPAVYGKQKYHVKSDAIGEYVTKNQLYNTNSKFNEVTCPSLIYLINYNVETGQVLTTDLDNPVSGSNWVTAYPHPNARPGLKYHAWRWSRHKVETNCADLEFRVHQAEGTTPRLQIWTKIRNFRQTALKDVIIGPSTVSALRELAQLGLGGLFETPKPTELLRLLIEAATDTGDLVVDFFAGSGSFGVAAANCSRRFILIQLDEKFSDTSIQAAQRLSLNTIADLCKERLQRAGVDFYITTDR